MKKFYYFLISLAILSLTSCNDWLDVSPRSQIESDILFQTEDGFKQALNGVYIKLGQSTLYGKDASMYLPETLAQMWQIPTEMDNQTMYRMAKYDFTDSGVETIISNTFKDYYNAIAQLNDILTNLKANKGVVFEYNNDKLIEGEILGLRAFLHLEVLRLWGPVPEAATNETLAVPYVTDITNDVSKLRSKTWGEIISCIESDLNQAEEILRTYDPITQETSEDKEEPKDQWQTMRQGRFNYYAVLGTKARFYHWIGNTSEAARYAKMVVDDNKMPLCTESTISKSLTMYQEHLFGIENINLLDIIKDQFDNSNANFTQTKTNVDKAYENTIHANDIRYTNNRYWSEKIHTNGAKVYTFYKFIGSESIESDKRIPLLRMAEMYLILIEDLPLEEAKPYFTTYRTARGLSSSIDEPSMASDEARRERLEMEYRKEFYGEGQMFFFYKKHNYDSFTWPKKFTMPANGYVIPKPKGMSNFE